MQTYHDTEWGVPVYDDRKLFEFLILDAFQAGLSWRTVLHKRENFRKAFANFDAAVVASFTNEKLAELQQDAGIIRNRQKIKAGVQNAQAFLTIQEAYGSFKDYIWQFTDGTMRVNQWTRMEDIPATSSASDAMSKDLKKRGFSFVGSTICYAFMQAAGMVNDHLIGCPRHAQCQRQLRAL